MRIVGLKEFLALPNGTVYAKYAPQYFSEWGVKTETLNDVDFCFTSLDHDMDCEGSDDLVGILQRLENDPTDSYPLSFDVGARDGCFERNQLFAIWDEADIDALIARLQEAKQEAKGV